MFIEMGFVSNGIVNVDSIGRCRSGVSFKNEIIVRRRNCAVSRKRVVTAEASSGETEVVHGAKVKEGLEEKMKRKNEIQNMAFTLDPTAVIASQKFGKQSLELVAESGVRGVDKTNPFKKSSATKAHQERTFQIPVIGDTLQSILLPRGYPESVAPYYMTYAKWHFLHNTATAANAVLATSALLQAAGLGAGGVAAAAAANWVIKDGVGNLARLIFGSKYAGRFDSDLKRFRMIADVLHHVGTGAELLTRVVPGWFLLVAAFGNSCKGMAQVIFVSTRSVVNRQLATSNNIGEVTARGDAQSILADLCGALVGIALTQTVAHEQTDAAMAFFLINVVLQMWFRFESLRSLHLDTLSNSRLMFLATHYTATGEMMTPEQLSVRENFVTPARFLPPSKFPVVPNALLASYKNPSKAVMSSGSQMYILGETIGSESISFSMKKGASSEDIIVAAFHAVLMSAFRKSLNRVSEPGEGEMNELLNMKFKKEAILEQLQEKGWQLHRMDGFEVIPIELSDDCKRLLEMQKQPRYTVSSGDFPMP